MRVLITGGTGHIGSRLAVGLRSFGIDVILTSRRNLMGEPWMEDIEWRQSDDVCTSDWERLIDGNALVVHLVSPREKDCLTDPDSSRKVVVEGSRRVGSAAATMNVPLFYFSTSQVYGARLTGKFDEGSDCLPETPYAAFHLEAEEALREICRDMLTVVRVANSVGLPANPGCDSWHLLTHDAVREATLRGTITLKSSGLQHRSFVPVSEVTMAVAKLIERPLPGMVVNITNEVSFSVFSMAHRVARIVEEMTGRKVTVNALRADPDDEENPFSLRSSSLRAAGYEIDCESALDEEIANLVNHVKSK